MNIKRPANHMIASSHRALCVVSVCSNNIRHSVRHTSVVSPISLQGGVYTYYHGRQYLKQKYDTRVCRSIVASWEDAQRSPERGVHTPKGNRLVKVVGLRAPFDGQAPLLVALYIRYHWSSTSKALYFTGGIFVLNYTAITT